MGSTAGPNRFVFDSYALIGYLENEPFAGSIQDILKSARQKKCRVFLHAIHLGEVYYITRREKGPQNADLAYVRIKRFPLTFIETIDETLLLRNLLTIRFSTDYYCFFSVTSAVSSDRRERA
jgi:uncharacterized protein